MNENEPVGNRVVVSNVPVADYSHLTSPEQLAAISRIEGVALVIVPESLAGAYAAIPTMMSLDDDMAAWAWSPST